MYAAHFNFREMPFSILPDPRFLYLSQAHSMALSMLEYGVLNQAGFTVVTGEIGSGKTTLVRHLLRSVNEDIRVALLSHTPCGGDNLLEWLLLAFDQPVPAGASGADLPPRARPQAEACGPAHWRAFRAGARQAPCGSTAPQPVFRGFRLWR